MGSYVNLFFASFGYGDYVCVLIILMHTRSKRNEQVARSENKPRAISSIYEIDLYVPGKSKAKGDGEVFKLSSNETPFGPSAAAREAFSAAASALEVYPDGSAAALRETLGAYHGIDPDQIVCGAGSDELLSLIAQAYLSEGDEAIYTTHGFLVYPIVIRANGATPVVAEETDLRADVDQILACVSDRTRIVFLANPNNPTGTYLPQKDIERLIEALPANVLLVLDGAYAEYVSASDYEAGIEFVNNHENVVMTRTFSKIYGLASLRLGWAYCPPEIADVLNRIRGPFNVSAPAMAAGVASIKDEAFLQDSIAHNKLWLEKLSDELRQIGLEVTPSVANFVLLHFPEKDGKMARDADAFLLEHGVILRRVENYHLPDCLRASIGSDAANEKLISLLRTFMQEGDTS